MAQPQAATSTPVLPLSTAPQSSAPMDIDQDSRVQDADRRNDLEVAELLSSFHQGSPSTSTAPDATSADEIRKKLPDGSNSPSKSPRRLIAGQEFRTGLAS